MKNARNYSRGLEEPPAPHALREEFEKKKEEKNMEGLRLEMESLNSTPAGASTTASAAGPGKTRMSN